MPSSWKAIREKVVSLYCVFIEDNFLYLYEKHFKDSSKNIICQDDNFTFHGHVKLKFNFKNKNYHAIKNSLCKRNVPSCSD